MHVCFASLDYPILGKGGGVATVTKILATALVEEGYDVSVILLGKEKNYFSEDGVTIYQIVEGSIHYYISKLPFIGSKLALTIRELERAWSIKNKLQDIDKRKSIDIIEFTEEGGFFSIFSSLKKKTKFICRLHGAEYSWKKKIPFAKLETKLKLQRLLQRFFIKRCNYLISPSKYYKDILLQEFGQNYRDKIVVMWNPLDWSYFNIEKDIDNQTKQKYQNTFLYCGRIQDAKGIDLLIKMVSSLKRDNVIIELNLAGNFHPSLSESELNKSLIANGIQDQVKVISHMSRDRLMTEMAKYEAVIVPSYFESFGMVGIEAIFANAKIIHTNVGFMHDISEELSGISIIPTNSVKEMEEKVLEFLEKNKNVEWIEQRRIEKMKLKQKLSVNNHLDFFKELL